MITQPAMEPGIMPLRVPVASLSILVCHKAAGFFSHPSTKYALQNCLTKILHDMVAFYSQQPKTYMAIVSIHGSTAEDHILSDLSTMTHPSWVVLWAWLSFIELGQGPRPGGATPPPRIGGCTGTGGPRGAIPHSRSEGAAARTYPLSKVRSSGCALLEQP